MGLKGYIARRLVYTVILIWAVITVNFIIFALMPGNPIEAYVSKLSKMDETKFQQMLKYYGLDKPLHERYLLSLEHLLTFNFGISYNYGSPVFEVIMQRLPNTLLLGGIAEVTSIILGMLIGVIVAYKRGGALDTGIVTASLLTYSVPIFFLGWVLITIFCLQLHWLPTGLEQPVAWSRVPPSSIFEYISGRLYHIALPAITLILFTVGGWILLTRACILEVISEDYVLTARAKGLKERTVLYKHVLKNASLPLITNVALGFAYIISGATITETLFSYRGMGLLTYSAIMTGPDLPLLQAIFYILALCVIIANLIADLLYGIIDPRIKYA
jgi:peptide/nickel transport system permease protein